MHAKKEVTTDFMWHLDQVVIPFPVAIVTTLDAAGRINAAPFGLILPFCSDPARPQLLLCTASMWHTSHNIQATGEFVVNYASCALVEKVARTGMLYSEGVNELEKAGLTALAALAVQPPRVAECYQHIECRLHDVIRPTDQQTNFIGDIVSISMDAGFDGKDRLGRLQLADPLLLFGVDVAAQRGSYAAVGKTSEYVPPLDEVE